MSDTSPPRRRSAAFFDWLCRRVNLTEVFSLFTSYGLFFAELDNRKPLPEALNEALDQPLPSLSRWPRILGLFVVVLLAIELLTGALLAFYYLPTPESAHASVGTILRDVNFGWLMHGMHYWAAQMLIVVLLARVLRFFFQATYRAPRELIWLFATGLLLVCFHADLTGRFLPWTSTAYWSGTRALEVVSAVPIYGSVVRFMLGAGDALVTDLTLLRYYILHIAVLPFLAVSLIYFHFSSVRRIGIVTTADEETVSGHQAIPRHAVNLLIMLTAIFGILVTLAVLVPTPFPDAADTFSTPSGVRPPWYLLSSYGFLELTSGFLPGWLAGGILFLFFIVFIVFPFLDRKPLPTAARWGLGIMVIAALVLLSVYGWRVA